MIEETISEKREFLKREEIRTMAKDIARLRETEAETEREKIATIKTEEVKKSPTPPSPPPKKTLREISPPGILIPKPLVKKPGHLRKFLARGAFVLIFILLSGLFYWFFVMRKPPVEETTPPEITQPTEEETPQPEIIVPLSLIPVVETKTFEAIKAEDISQVFQQLQTEDLPQNAFTRIVVKNPEENRLLSPQDFFQSFQVKTPAELYQKLEDFTLAIFPQKEGDRFAFVAEINDLTGLNALLANWEKEVLKGGVSVAGKTFPALFPSFRTGVFQGMAFRYLTISKNDLGICYALLDNYFVLTTSFESLKKIIGELKPLIWEKKAGQLFIVGFDETAVTPELEEFFKEYQPGGVLLLSKNIESREQLKSLISGLQDISLKTTGLPLFISVDQEGGVVSRIDFLEEKTPQSEIKSIEEAYTVGLKRGQELKDLGVNLNLAPLLDFSQEGDFLFSRSFQKTPLEIGNYSKALITGQKTAGIFTTIKHFPGYDGVSTNPEEELTTLNVNPEFSQFKKALEANPEMVMTSNLVYNEIDPLLPLVFSQKGVQFLKNNLGKDILVTCDDLSQNSLLNKFSLKEIVTKPVEAGVDILLFSGYRTPVKEGLDEFRTALKQKEVSEVKINAAISRIIQLKQKLLSQK